MKKDTIFIHIPKTGGTSINTAIQNTEWQTEPNFYYRHIVLKSKMSNAGDIFLEKNQEKYKQYKIFMMLRHPVDRMISEYYFIRERKNFIDLLHKKPTSFESYIKNRQTQNGVITFLKGRRFFDIKKPTENDLDDILNAIDELPVHIGIFEHFADSLQYFTQVSKIDLNKKIDVKRMTFRRPAVEEIGKDIKELILQNNQLDWELYQYGLDKFNKIKSGLKNSDFIFNKDKYRHVIPYAAQTCLFEFCMQNKKYIQQNLKFFRDLTLFLLKKRNIRDGRIYTEVWNDSYIKAVSKHFPGSELSDKLKSITLNQDPLEMTFQIAQATDRFLKHKKHLAQEFYRPMEFNPSFVKEIAEPLKEKKGFLNRLFGKK